MLKKLKKVIKKMQTKKAYFFETVLFYFLMANVSYASEDLNHLKGLKDSVAATFGAGSDISYYLYLAEGLGCAYGYIKTKDIKLLLSLPILIIFTNWALSSSPTGG
jgi:hypothetical protein